MTDVTRRVGFCCRRDHAAAIEEMNTLQQELKRNTDELETISRKNADMVYLLSIAIPTLKDLLNNVSK